MLITLDTNFYLVLGLESGGSDAMNGHVGNSCLKDGVEVFVACGLEDLDKHSETTIIPALGCRGRARSRAISHILLHCGTWLAHAVDCGSGSFKHTLDARIFF